MRKKVKFLTVVWGETYIARFASLALPSFIAPGNLPALAEATDLEVVIMTRRDDIVFFETHATFLALRKICPVRFVEIDDLITTAVYGVTLTLAYARPIIACGKEMLNIHFVFMNADFVLADGSLHSLCKHILDGRSIVLGPSFRATAEEMEPLLKSELDKAGSGVLAIPQRQLASLSLAHPHATTVAKTLNQTLIHSTHPNQFFWQIDEHTLLGRYYLIFMLCLKPERVIDTINSYCDYALIPELCPSGDEIAMGDSDDFFMLELQERRQENYMLHLGRPSEHDIAASLQRWTTAEHRRAAHHDILFHTGEIPAGVAATKKEAQAFINRIEKKLGQAVPHAEHVYWIRGVEAWKNYRKRQNLTASPPELAANKFTQENWIYKYRRYSWLLAYTVHSAIIGTADRPTPVNPDWLDNRILHDTLARLSTDSSGRTLITGDSQGLLRFLMGPKSSAEFANTEEVRSRHFDQALKDRGGYRHILIYITPTDWTNVRLLAERCLSLLDDKGDCCIFLHNRNGEMYGDQVPSELLSLLDATGGTRKCRIDCTFVGGLLKRLNRELFSLLGRTYAKFGTPALLWILPLSVVALPLSLATNLYLKKNLSSYYTTGSCSSMIIRIQPVGEKYSAVY